jgi:hypothetical protein
MVISVEQRVWEACSWNETNGTGKTVIADEELGEDG